MPISSLWLILSAKTRPSQSTDVCWRFVAMKILLISANTLTAPYPVYPLGLDYVAFALSPAHDVGVADLMALDGSAGLAAAIRDFSPDLIGLGLRNVDNTDISAPEGFVGQYQNLVRSIRKASDAPLVLGGSGFTIFPDEMMAALNADFGIVGEGERLRALADALEAGADLSGLSGVINGRGKAKTPYPLTDPVQRRFDPAAPHVGIYLNRSGTLNLQTKRGCPFRCVYCTYPQIEGRRMRRIPPEEVADTAIRLQEAGARYLFITDSAFNADPDHSAAVARSFKAAGLSIPWAAFLAPMNPPSGYYQTLADAGMTHAEFGTESLSDQVLDRYGKPFRTLDVFQSHQSALDAGLYIAHYFLLGGPGEDPETLSKTLSQVDKLDKSVLFFFCGMRIYPRTALYDIALEEQQISTEQSLLSPVFYQSKSIDNQEILHQVREKANSRRNWIIGAGGDKTADVVSRMHQRGFSGPLWEYLI